jgi:hypothetical protein
MRSDKNGIQRNEEWFTKLIVEYFVTYFTETDQKREPFLIEKERLGYRKEDAAFLTLGIQIGKQRRKVSLMFE